MTNVLVKTAAIAATFLTVSVPALAFEQAQPRPALTRVALQQQIQTRFAALDTNHDGAVTQAEFDAQRARMKGEHRAAAFTRLDADKNGQISRDEFLAEPKPRDGERAMHGRGEGMRDGMHRRHGGMRAGMAGGFGMGGPRGFAMLDANSDGRVTLAEASSRALARFDAVDTNKDGQITPEERKAAHDAMRAAWAAKRG